jgi:restriction system protein
MGRLRASLIKALARLPWPVWAALSAGGWVVFIVAHKDGLIQFLGLSVGLLCFIAMAAAFIGPQRSDRGIGPLTGPQDLRGLSLDDFESLLAGAYGRLGYDIIDDPEGGGAEGVDVRIYKDGRLTLVQTKHWRDEVDEAMVSGLCGAVAVEKAAQGVVVTTSGFTPQARRFAQGKPLALIDGPALWELVKDPSPV